jgi:hypothetical protein
MVVTKTYFAMLMGMSQQNRNTNTVTAWLLLLKPSYFYLLKTWKRELQPFSNLHVCALLSSTNKFPIFFLVFVAKKSIIAVSSGVEDRILID